MVISRGLPEGKGRPAWYARSMQCPRAAIFDLDDTLAESFKPMSGEVLDKLKRLLARMPIAIMTGSGMKRMSAQFLPTLQTFPHIERFYLFPNSSAQCYVFDAGEWKQLYNFALTPEEREKIKTVILKALDNSDLLRDIPHFGERMFDREAQIAYTPVGIEATLEQKKAWDPSGAKRKQLRDTLAQALPDLEILMGGTTTVDITRKGINKAYGVKWLSERLSLPASEMLYVGDAFDEDGNDRVVIPTGIQTHAVSGPDETPAILDSLLTVCS